LIDLSRKKLFLFDLDGVLLAGKEDPVRLGGPAVIKSIRRRGKRLFVLTNDSTDSVETIYKRLGILGIPVEKEEILSCARLTAEYIAKKHPKGAYFLVGEPGLAEELDMQGLRRTEGDEADVVVVGLDRNLTYDKLDKAAELARNGAEIVSCHSAHVYAFRGRTALAVGPLLKAIEYGSERRGVSIGKPSKLMFRLALEKAGCKPKDAVMIGDQEDTDVVGAMKMGIDSVLVTTGVYDGKAKTKAKAVFKTVDDMAGLV
jgi:4-nitrophenyl phosphatase